MEKIQTHNSSTRSEDGIKFITIKGSLDSFNVYDVSNYIGEILSTATEQTIVFELEGLNFITAHGIVSFINIIENYKDKKNVYLKDVNTTILEQFKLLGFYGCFHFITSTDEIANISNVLFPKTLNCPSCNNKIIATKSGKFKCPACKSTISVNKEGKIDEEE